MNPIAIRLLNQQLISPLFSKPEEVVSHMGAIQAQEYRLMRWAVAMRTKEPSYYQFENAFNSGEIIRMHLFRGTWQLISGNDYAWMLKLCAPRSLSVIKGWMKSNKISIPNNELSSIWNVLEIVADEKKSATKDDFIEGLLRKDIVIDDRRLSYCIRMAEINGLLCSGILHTSKATYCLASQKIKNHSDVSYEESLALLAKKYFQSHSPATLEDYVWWSGLSVSECKKGINLIKNELQTQIWQEKTFYIHHSCRLEGFQKGTTLLISPYDEYLIGYKSRELVLPNEYRQFAHNKNGTFYPIIAYDGVICGNWKPFLSNLEIKYFDANFNSASIDEAWERYNYFKKIITV